jgi:energy-coupling factor transporter ATP-binding protein EcfA2
MREHVFTCTGESGTGKSFLLKLMIEIIKHISMKSGDELQKPPAIVMAPTANAAYIVNGKTVDSLGIIPRKENAFKKGNPGRMSKFTFLYTAVIVVFCDEISMIGSSKFKVYKNKFSTGLKEFMGGLSFVAVGDFHQLPPVNDRYVYENNKLDGGPEIAPSHWDENFEIFYLTKKVRSKKAKKESFPKYVIVLEMGLLTKIMKIILGLV